jgi:NAD(P)H dehydrogenase (quinone)
MILVTGATGHFGNASIQFLLEKGIKANQILALVRNGQATETFNKLGVGTVMGDYDDYDSLVNAFKGVEKLLLISGNDVEKRMLQHQNAIRAAKQAGVKHIVYTSFLRRVENEASPLWLLAHSHIQTEKWLKESGIACTILKNNIYMDFLPGFIGEKVAEKGVIYVPAQNGKVGAVLRSEMAEAAASILSSSGHEGKEYDITNSEALSYQEIANILSEVLGKPINYISPTAEEYKNTLLGYGVPKEGVEIFSSIALAQAEGELDLTSNDLEILLGRKPMSIKDFLVNFYSVKAASNQ